ncbi:MAG TPA: hypothetical protein VL147_01640 [Devosia sp.]|nr:hypothetical protein [Devosia sp.]
MKMVVIPAIEPAFILLDGGIVKASSTTGANGIVRHVHGLGVARFFVSVVDKAGGETGLWAGAEYEDAMRQAEAARQDFGIDEPVHDLVAGGPL